MDRYRDDRRSRSGVNAGTSTSPTAGHTEVSRELLETGAGFVLLEAGDRLLLEQ